MSSNNSKTIENYDFESQSFQLNLDYRIRQHLLIVIFLNDFGQNYNDGIFLMIFIFVFTNHKMKQTNTNKYLKWPSTENQKNSKKNLGAFMYNRQLFTLLIFKEIFK